MDIKAQFFVEIMVCLMVNMEKELNVPKWALIVWPKMPQNYFEKSKKQDDFEILASMTLKMTSKPQ